jgi:dihydrofolate reductase
MRTHCDIIHSVIHDFDLFIIGKKTFKSLSIEKRLNERNNKSIKASESANKRWKNANALPSQCERNAIKERKGKEIKKKKVVLPSAVWQEGMIL